MLSLGEITRLNAKRVGNEIAIIWHGVRETHKKLDARTNSIANALISMGVKKGTGSLSSPATVTSLSRYILPHPRLGQSWYR